MFLTGPDLQCRKVALLFHLWIFKIGLGCESRSAFDLLIFGILFGNEPLAAFLREEL